MSFLGEIKRRKVFQVAAVYAVAAWLIVQVVAAVNEPLNLPDWLDTVVIVLLASGFPIAIILAWAFDLAPAASKSGSEGVASKPISTSTAQRYGYISQGLVLIAVGFLVVDQYLLGSGSEEQRDSEPEDSVITPVRPVTRFLVTPPSTAPLANMGGFDVAISHDGTKMVYYGQDPETGEVALYLRDFNRLGVRRIQGSEVAQPQGGLNPFFSPDDQWVGFHVPGEGIYRQSISGGPSLKMFDTPGGFLGAAWASDGTVIFSSGATLFRASANGGNTLVPLTPEPNTSGEIYVIPKLLPDESAVIFGLLTPGEGERLAVLDLESGKQKILLPELGQNPVFADTGHIIYASGSTLLAVPFDPEELTATPTPVTLLPGVRQEGEFAAADYALSRTGTLIYVPESNESGGREIVWVDRDGQVTGRAVDDPVVGAADPRLSPNGRQFSLTTNAIDQDIWIYDLSGRPPIPLAIQSSNRSAVWSPDGMRVAFASFRGATNNIYVVPADGTVRNPQPLRSGPIPAHPSAWSDEGELLLRPLATGLPSFGNTTEDIVAVNVEQAGEVRDVVVTSYDEFDAALSPDGMWLAYVSNITGGNEVWVMPYPEGPATRVSPNGGVEPLWSHDGRELFYRSGNSMLVIQISSQNEVEFSHEPAVELFNERYFLDQTPGRRSYDVARDGRFLMIRRLGDVAGTAWPQIVVVENWLEELRGLLLPTE